MGVGVVSTPPPMPAPHRSRVRRIHGHCGPERLAGPAGRLGSTMLVFLAVLLFVVAPIVELWVIVEVAGAVGIVPTLALLLAISVAGSLLVRREGLGVLRRARTMWRSGRVPTDDILDGVLVLAAGALLLAPGFVTDALGLLLLVGPLRRFVGSLSFSRIQRLLRLPVAGAEFVGGMAGGRRSGYGADGSRTVYVGEAVVVGGRPSLAPHDAPTGAPPGGPHEPPKQGV